MTTNATTPDYTDISALAREANRLCRLRYSADWQFHLFEQWSKRIDRAQSLGNGEAVAELNRLISILRS